MDAGKVERVKRMMSDRNAYAEMVGERPDRLAGLRPGALLRNLIAGLPVRIGNQDYWLALCEDRKYHLMIPGLCYDSLGDDPQHTLLCANLDDLDWFINAALEMTDEQMMGQPFRLGDLDGAPERKLRE